MARRRRIRRRTVIVATGAALLPYIKPEITSIDVGTAQALSGAAHHGEDAGHTHEVIDHGPHEEEHREQERHAPEHRQGEHD